MLKINRFSVQMRLGDVVFLVCHTLLFSPVFAHHIAPASHHAPVAVFAHVSNGECYFFNPVSA
jgi:multisubunit Na+/H+ antiporter MnhG subunit